jgi:hypothetical protein
MEKAFELKGLVEKLKVHGLDLTEEMAKLVALSSIDWVEESVKLSENKYDDFAIPVIETLKPFLMKEIDKINGKADEVAPA